MDFKWLDFKITNRCNNRCTYCGVKQAAPASAEQVALESLQLTVEDSLHLGFTHFAFLGGEPSIRGDFPQIVQPLQQESEAESVMVISNMLVFNESMYRAVFETTAKHAQVVTSVDNLQEPNYKHQETAKTLKCICTIQAMAQSYQEQGRGIRQVHVHSVISRENFTRIFEHVSYFQRMGIDVSLALVEPFIIIKEHTKVTLGSFNQFTRMEIEAIIQELDKLEHQGILNWANHVLREYMNKTLNQTLADSYALKCTAGNAHVIIEADGNVYPCLTEAYRKGLKYGNITSERFRDIYPRMCMFKCESPFQQTCWDHYLWTRLEKLVEGH